MAIFAISVFLSVYFSYSRYQVQSRLTKSEELLRAIFDETVDSLFLVDLSNLKILECNASAIKMFGFADKKEIIDSGVVEKLDLTEAAMERVKNGQVYHTQKFYQTKSGGFWGNIVIHTLSLASKDRALMRITDISPLMGVEQELASKVKELEEKNLSKM
jgi:PAS domain S-box-containing protein